MSAFVAWGMSPLSNVAFSLRFHGVPVRSDESEGARSSHPGTWRPVALSQHGLEPGAFISDNGIRIASDPRGSPALAHLEIPTPRVPDANPPEVQNVTAGMCPLRLLWIAAGAARSVRGVPLLTLFWLALLAIAAAEGPVADGSANAAAGDVLGGKAIYVAQCASCHGEQGQGVAGAYEQALYGDHTLGALTRLIERTMPEGDAEACQGDDAAQVAAYIYHEFYSLAARQRLGLVERPRVELSRLTVNQYRNTVADLLSHFTPRAEGQHHARAAEDEHAQPGLAAEYFASKGMSKADQLGFERIDPSVDFDFGTESPGKDIPADQFAIIWQGALIAPRTGHYEFRIRSQNGARFYLNQDASEQRHKLRDDSSVAGQAAVIDAWVSSGKMRESTARLFLLGGRTYPLRLEFFKYKEELASIQFEWKPPHGAWEVLDASHVTTARVPRTFVVETPFPADDRSLGYERGSSVSSEWHAATTNAGIEVADEVLNRIGILVDVDEKASVEERTEKLRAFTLAFAERAFRRPLSEPERELFGGRLFADVSDSDRSDPEAALRRAVILTLKSPSFLYLELRTPGVETTSYMVASRLSYALWDSAPDQPLLDAAAAGELLTAEQVAAHANRMLAMPAARAKMSGFFEHWLELEYRDLSKDKELFPGFSESVIGDLRRSLELFLDQVVWSETSDYRQLLLADYLLLNPRLQQLYGEPAETTSDDGENQDEDQGANQSQFDPVAFPAQLRAGVLTHPYLLSAFAYHNHTSPIHRGVFLTRNVVGRGLKPPPIAVAFKDDEFAPDLTMREKVTQLTRDQACMSCHAIINPLGYALENYDAIGRWRVFDNDKPVDPRSKYVTVEGDATEVASARDIAELAVASENARRAFVTQLFQHLVKQNPNAYGTDTLDRLQAEFVDREFHIQHLMARIAELSALHSLPASTKE
jgi:mono/diheme cytochrome c family protein